MSLLTNPGVVTDGLVFYYDMGNTAKSYRGEPTTNQFAIPTPDSNGFVSFSVNGTGTFQRIYSGTFGDYTIQPSDIVYRYDLGTNGCHYHGNDVTITAGQFPTFTFDYYLSPTVTSFGDTFMANFENLGSGVSGSAALPNLYKGVWQTIQINGNQASATSGLRMLLYPGGCSGGRLAATGFVLMKNPQVTFSSTSGKVLPFVAGTRSNTQALLDMVGQNTLTASSLTYGNDNTFSFNGSSDLIIFPENSSFNTQTPSVEVWIKTNATSQNGFWFEKGNVNTQYSLFQEGGNIVWRQSSNVGSLTALTASYISTSNWAQVVGTYTSGDRRIYVNGVQVASDALSYSIPTNANGCSIGVYGGFNGGRGYYYNGSIAIVRVYNKALTPSEVQQNFSALRGRFSI